MNQLFIPLFLFVLNNKVLQIEVLDFNQTWGDHNYLLQMMALLVLFSITSQNLGQDSDPLPNQLRPVVLSYYSLLLTVSDWYSGSRTLSFNTANSKANLEPVPSSSYLLLSLPSGLLTKILYAYLSPISPSSVPDQSIITSLISHS